MDKQQQIEEIAGTICNACKERFEISKKCKNVIEPCLAAYAHAEAIYAAGYRKVSKNYIGTDEILRSIDYRPTEEVRKETAKEFAEKVKMAFYYEFDEIIPSIMSDKIDELLKEYEK